MVNKTLIFKTLAFVAVLAVLAGGYVAAGKFAGIGVFASRSNVTVVTAQALNAELKQAKTPVLVEICAPVYPDCAAASAAVDAAAGKYNGRIKFLLLDAADPANKALLQNLLGSQHDLPAYILVNSGMPLWATTGKLSSSELGGQLDRALAALNMDGNSLVVQANADNVGQIVQSAQLPVVVEFCSNQDQDCTLEAAHIAYAAAFYKGQVEFVVFNIDTATTDQQKAFVQNLAANLHLQHVPSFVFMQGKYVNVTGASTAADLSAFVAASLKAAAATH